VACIVESGRIRSLHLVCTDYASTTDIAQNASRYYPTTQPRPSPCSKRWPATHLVIPDVDCVQGMMAKASLIDTVASINGRLRPDVTMHGNHIYLFSPLFSTVLLCAPLRKKILTHSLILSSCAVCPKTIRLRDLPRERHRQTIISSAMEPYDQALTIAHITPSYSRRTIRMQ
jgi:hypothetical protein